MLRNTGNWFMMLAMAAALLAGCNKDDGDSIITTPDDIRDATSANNYMINLYSEITRQSIYLDAMVIMPLLFSDNCRYAGNQDAYWKEASDMEIDPENDTNWEMFTDLYGYNQDLIILFNQLDTTEDATLTDDVKDGFRAEGRALRAMTYYYLNAYWGPVPLVDETTDQTDTNLLNATEQQIYDFIEADLLFAEANIDKNTYITSTTRLGPTAVKGWLARFYLQKGQWSDAFDYAEDVILTGSAFLEDDYADIFNVNSSEHLWVLPENLSALSLAVWFLQSFSNGNYVVRPRELPEFETGDLRRSASLSVPGTTVIKYKDVAGNTDPAYLLRLAEIYLIASEAAARLGEYETASGYLNAIRDRAGLDSVQLTADNYAEVLLRERNAELCYEGFHRLMDLRRFEMAEQVLGPYGYEAKDDLWPMPQQVLDQFSTLDQNPGY